MISTSRRALGIHSIRRDRARTNRSFEVGTSIAFEMISFGDLRNQAIDSLGMLLDK